MDWRATVRQWLEANQRPQSYVAARAEVTPQYLSLCLQGKEDPSGTLLHALESAMGLEHGALGKGE